MSSDEKPDNPALEPIGEKTALASGSALRYQVEERIMMNGKYFIICITLILCFAVSVVQSKEYWDEHLGYRIWIPDSWSKIPNDKIEFLNNTNAKLAKEYPHISFPQYSLGFQESKASFLSFPFILIQHLPPDAMRFPNESEKTNHKIEESKTTMGKSTISSRFKNMNIDHVKKAISITGESDTPGMGTSSIINYCVFGKMGIVNIFCFSAKEDTQTNYPVFKSIMDSVHFDKGFEYIVEGNIKIYGRRPFYMVIVNCAIGAIIGVGMYYLGAAALKRLRRKKVKSDP